MWNFKLEKWLRGRVIFEEIYEVLENVDQKYDGIFSWKFIVKKDCK